MTNLIRCAGFLSPTLPSKVLYRASTRLCHACAVTDKSADNKTSARPGNLYLVSTPIGNSRDISNRAISILSTVDIIAAEDTRRTGLLLKDILSTAQRSSRLVSCHEHNVRERTPFLIQSLQARQSVALVSDAGTPCISDPGRQLVTAAISQNIPIVPVPGPSAVLSVLVCSGFPLDSFLFVGFLPRSGGSRKAAVERVGNAVCTVVLYEAPHRLLSTLETLADHVGMERPLCIGREITKRYEEFRRFASVRDAIEWYETSGAAPRGEFSLVLGPSVPVTSTTAVNEFAETNVDIRSVALALLAEGIPVKSISKSVSALTKVSKKEVYAYVSQLKNELVGTVNAGKT